MKYYEFFPYRACCIKHNLFSAGTNEQYAKVCEMMREGITLHDLALVTWLCSSDVTLGQVKDLLKNSLHAR